MPQANSMTSSPRCTSPLASSITLPCSLESSSARLCILASINSLNLNMTRARFLRIGRGPFGLDLLGSFDRAVEQSRIAERDFGLDFAGRGVPDLVFAGCARAGPADDEMIYLTHFEISLLGCPWRVEPRGASNHSARECSLRGGDQPRCVLARAISSTGASEAFPSLSSSSTCATS